MSVSKFVDTEAMKALCNENNRQRFCVGWNVILPGVYPVDGETFSLNDRKVLTEVCQHGNSCKVGQEILYFLMQLIVSGFVEPQGVEKYWRFCFPQKGCKLVKWSDETPDLCAGFRLASKGKATNAIIPEKLVDFDANGLPYTRICNHSSCDLSDKYMFALIRVFAAGCIPKSISYGKKHNVCKFKKKL